MYNESCKLLWHMLYGAEDVFVLTSLIVILNLWLIFRLTV